MRSSGLLLALLLAASPAQALIEDPTGDPSIEPGGHPAGALGKGADLRSLELVEDEGGFLFTLDAADLENSLEDPTNAAIFLIHLRFQDTQYIIEWSRFVTLEPAIEPSLTVKLLDAEGNDLQGLEWETPFEVYIPRGALPDSTGDIPAGGRDLEDIYVTSSATPSDIVQGELLDVHVVDRMPDTGAVSFPVQQGPVTVGDLHLSSDRAFRTTNGNAVTLLYLLQATGPGSMGRIEIEDAPDGWGVVVPDGDFKIVNETIPILVDLPSTHQHGAFQTVRLRLTDGPSVARADIGVNFLAVPRPERHHNTLLFHTAQYADDAINNGAETATGMNFARKIWFNTITGDSRDEGVEVSGFATSNDTISGYGWVANLDPELRDGIHFTSRSSGEIQVPFHFAFPATIRLHGTLTWIPENDEPWVVGNITPTGSVEVGQDGDALLSGIIHSPETRLDLDGETGVLRLDLLVATEGPQPPAGPTTQPTLLPGGAMRLPLEDYYPPTELDLVLTTGIELDVPATVQVSPGMPVLLNVTMLPQNLPSVLSLHGTAADWVEIKEDGLVISVPEGTPYGSFGDLVIQSSVQGDPLRMAVARVVVEIGDESSLPAYVERQAKVAPTTPVLALIALGCALLARRRKR